MAHIERLFVHPVKSCGGIDVPIAEMTERGLRFDREFAVVGADGVAMTQREHPRMALVGTAIRPGELLLRVPGASEISVSLDGEVSVRRRIRVWDDDCEGADAGDEAAKAFSNYLGARCRLVRRLASHPRLHKSTTLGRSISVSFADAYPLLVISEASLADLNRRCPERIPMDRFRPNIVLGGVEPYAEDAVAEIVVGDVRLQGANPCVRCAVTTTNQQTAERGVEPLRTLATYRRVEKGVIFGRNFVTVTTGRVRAGDTVRLVANPA